MTRTPKRGARAAAEIGRGGERPTGPSGVLDAGRRLHRLLAILSFLAAASEASILEIGERFSMTETEVVAELELAACCGLPPYTPDTLIELLIENDRVTAEGLGGLARPGRLTPAEGFAVAVAARAILAVPGADPLGHLRSALEKLEATLGEARLAVVIDQPPQLVELRKVVDRDLQLEIVYESRTLSEPLEIESGEIEPLEIEPGDRAEGRLATARSRIVDPYQLVVREGRWYLDGYCHTAAGVRRFAVERITAFSTTGVTVTRPAREDLPPGLDQPSAFVAGPEALVVRLAVPATKRFILDRLQSGPSEELADGRLGVTVLSGSDHFLGRLLLRLGPDAEVLDPPSAVRTRERAARAALRRYGIGGGEALGDRGD